MVVEKVRTAPALSISCSASSVIDKLVETCGTADTMEAGVFNFMLSDEHLKDRLEIGECTSYRHGTVLARYRTRKDGSVVFQKDGSPGFRYVDCQFFNRADAGTRLYTTSEGWLAANRAGLRLENILDAIAAHGFVLISSSNTFNASNASPHNSYMDGFSHEYIFRRRCVLNQ